MTLEFVFVTYTKGTQICKGVIQKSELANIQPGTFNCTSHCEIEIKSEKYTVLWKLVPCNSPPMDGDCQSKDDLRFDQPPDDTLHCLPFKVLGTCYKANRQTALEEAFMYLEEYNRPIFAKLEAEPDNVNDKHAIAVYVMSSSDYEKVGYLPRELTQYVHPVLQCPSLNVSINNIRFSTTFRMIGFYLTLDITKRGLWAKEVIKASQKVK